MTLLAELAAAWIAVSLAVDGLRKVPNADAFARWLRTGGLPGSANRPVVYAVAALETAAGVASVHPIGRTVAIGLIVLVTPVGAVLVRRTGVCACRGVVRSNTALHLTLRNAAAAAVGAATLAALGGPVGPGAVLAAALAWLAVGLARHVLTTKAPVREVTP